MIESINKNRRRAWAHSLLCLLLPVLLGFFGQNVQAHPMFPKNLSETLLYRDIESQEREDDILTYQVRFPLFSGDIEKRRDIKIPSGETIDGSSWDAWSFPENTRIWKHFSQRLNGALVPIETRMMIRSQDHWHFATYIWNDQASEAVLWDGEDGRSPISVSLQNGQVYEAPSHNQCLQCHGNASVTASKALGLNSFQVTDRSLDQFLGEGLLQSPPIPPSRRQVQGRNPLEESVIGYIHGNCAHCHNPSRHDILPSLDMNLSYSMSQISNWMHVPLLQQVGRPYQNRGVPWAHHSPRSRRITPRDPMRSMLFYRMEGAPGNFRMPQLGDHTQDRIFLQRNLRPWILSL